MEKKYEQEEIIELYHRHVNTVYAICYLLLHNQQDAEDATQTTFLKLIQSQRILCDTEHEKAWLITTARNHCKNILSHWWRKKRTPIEMDEIAENTSHSEDVLPEVLTLPKKYQIPIYLFYYEGYSTAEIALMFDTKESTIRSQLHRGRSLLKTAFEEGGTDYGKQELK